MAEQINNNSNEPGFLKALIVYCYNKMIKNEIFRYEELDKDIIISSIKELILLLKPIKVKFKEFSNIYNRRKKKFFYKKAFLSFIFRCLLLIFQIMILFLITYPKNLSIEKEIEKMENKLYFLN